MVGIGWFVVVVVVRGDGVDLNVRNVEGVVGVVGVIGVIDIEGGWTGKSIVG